MEHIVWFVTEAHEGIKLLLMENGEQSLLEVTILSQIVLEALGEGFDMAEDVVMLVLIVKATNSCECLSRQVMSLVHIRTPRFASFVKAVVAGVCAEDEQQRHD